MLKCHGRRAQCGVGRSNLILGEGASTGRSPLRPAISGRRRHPIDKHTVGNRNRNGNGKRSRMVGSRIAHRGWNAEYLGPGGLMWEKAMVGRERRGDDEIFGPGPPVPFFSSIGLPSVAAMGGRRHSSIQPTRPVVHMPVSPTARAIFPSFSFSARSVGLACAGPLSPRGLAPHPTEPRSVHTRSASEHL